MQVSISTAANEFNFQINCTNFRIPKLHWYRNIYWYKCSLGILSNLFCCTGQYRNLPFFLLFAVPPDIVDSATSGDITIKEGENVTFTCSAIGHPEPRILWRREDGSHLIIQTGPHETQKGIFSFIRTIDKGSKLLTTSVSLHEFICK